MIAPSFDGRDQDDPVTRLLTRGLPQRPFPGAADARLRAFLKIAAAAWIVPTDAEMALGQPQSGRGEIAGGRQVDRPHSSGTAAYRRVVLGSE